MREYRINMTAWGISRWAYEELRAFCRQYPEKKATAAALLGVQAGSRIEEHQQNGKTYGVVTPRSNRISDPVADAAAKRAPLIADCALIEHVAMSTDGGQWKDALMLNCCHGIGYELLDPAVLPNSNRNAFFRARREFFFRLHQAKYGAAFDTPGAVETW